MTEPLLPLIVEPAELEHHLGDDRLLIVDLCPRAVYEDMHVPGAVHLDPAMLASPQEPAVGKLPSDAWLSEVFSAIGLIAENHVVAYDDEGGGWASRLLWTLDVIGHRHYSLLNGGICSWLTEGHPTSEGVELLTPQPCTVVCNNHGHVDKEYVKNRLGNPGLAIVDARSPAEYRGEDRRAARGGHIPGAVNLDWTSTMDRARKLRFKPDDDLRERLLALGITPDKEVIVYCQTHHRSSHTYIMLKALGYPNVKAYAGSWAEWGNSPDTPVIAGSSP